MLHVVDMFCEVSQLYYQARFVIFSLKLFHLFKIFLSNIFLIFQNREHSNIDKILSEHDVLQELNDVL